MVGETVEKKRGHDSVVRAGTGIKTPRIGVFERDACPLARAESVLRHRQHRGTGIHRMDADVRRDIQQCAQEPSIPIAQQENVATRCQTIEICRTRALQGTTERGDLKRMVDAGHAIEPRHQSR